MFAMFSSAKVAKWRYLLLMIIHYFLSLSGSYSSSINGDYKYYSALFVDLIKFNLNFQPLPVTIRIPYLGVANYTELTRVEILATNLVQADFEEKPYAFLLGNNKPFLESSDNKSLTTRGIRGKIEMFKYTVIIFITSSERVMTVLTVAENSINKRHDRTIFVTETAELFNVLIKNKVVQGLRDKYFFALTSDNDQNHKIFTDPLIFDKYNSTALVSVSSVKILPLRKAMGGLLRGRHFMTGQSEVFHWAYILSKEKDGKVNFAGSFHQIQVESMKRFNYTLDIQLLDTYAEFKEGRWEGSTGCVLNGECDFSMCLSPEYLWGSQMDFSPWLDTARLIYWTNHPRKDPKWYGFLMPLSHVVWACLISTLVVFTMLLVFTVYMQENSSWTRRVFETGIELPFAILLEQGEVKVPQGLLRYLTGMWMFAAIIFGTGYKSTLRKNLIFPPEDSIPLTHYDLAERKDYASILYSFGELEVEHFRSSTDSKIQKIHRRLKITPDRMECLYKVVLNYKQTCSSWYPPSAMLIAQHLTLSTLVEPMIRSKDQIAMSYMTLAFPKDSIITDSFSAIVAAISESGIYRQFAEEETYKLKRKGVEYWKTVSEEEKQSSQIYKVLKGQVDSKDKSDTKPLTFTSCCGFFLFIPIGGLAAFLVFIWEKKLK